jgi:hypothetical protein
MVEPNIFIDPIIAIATILMADPVLTIVFILGIVTIAMIIVAILHKNVIYVLIAYAIASVCFSAIFFLLASRQGGALTMTVGQDPQTLILFVIILSVLGGIIYITKKK